MKARITDSYIRSLDRFIESLGNTGFAEALDDVEFVNSLADPKSIKSLGIALKPEDSRFLKPEFIEVLRSRKDVQDIYDTELSGFCLTLRRSGVKSFSVKYRNSEGRNRTFTIGKWGDHLTLTQAKSRAKQLVGQTNNDIDIQAEKKRKRTDADNARQQTLRVFMEE